MQDRKLEVFVVVFDEGGRGYNVIQCSHRQVHRKHLDGKCLDGVEVIAESIFVWGQRNNVELREFLP